MARVGATYTFEAAHFLPLVPDGHKCRRMHGHNYKIEVMLSSPALDERGFVIDFAELDEAMLPLIAKLDHRTLNEIPGLENPTAEIIAEWFRDKLKEGIRGFYPHVRVWETDRYFAEA